MSEGSGPRLEPTSVSISTLAPRRLAAFYAELFGVEVAVAEDPGPGEPPDAGWAQLRAPGPVAMTLNFEWDPHFEPSTWPSEPGRQQVQAHLDVLVDDLDTAEAWARRCGATVHPHQPQGAVRVMVDPDGHPFCLFAAH